MRLVLIKKTNQTGLYKASINNSTSNLNTLEDTVWFILGHVPNQTFHPNSNTLLAAIGEKLPKGFLVKSCAALRYRVWAGKENN